MSKHVDSFLSHCILRIFAAHLTAVAGKVRVDSLVEFGKPGYQTALALTAVAVSFFFISLLGNVNYIS
jgi:hypothetical protein